MKIERIQIRNFRNFQELNIVVGDHLVIVGENAVGKSNFLHALRLVFDPGLPDSCRQLRREDFWDGMPRPLGKGAEIRISVDLAEFEGDRALLAELADFLVETDPMVARLTYVFRPNENAGPEPTFDEFEFLVFGGEHEARRFGYGERRRLPLNFFHALRDAESDLAAWRRSPLRPLLERAWATVSEKEKEEVQMGMAKATGLLTDIPEVQRLEDAVTTALRDLAGGSQAGRVGLGVVPTDGDRLLRALTLLLDGGKRRVGDASLGDANLIYLTLKLLELQQLVDEGERDHTFLAIEEPEAHLHPHLQRQVFRTFLRLRAHQSSGDKSWLEDAPTTILLTTHSPNIVSVAPLGTVVVLREGQVQGSDGDYHDATVGVSTATLEFDPRTHADMERYLDVTRAELFFARGVILVEGEAEQYLVPTIAALYKKPLDSLGISVCAVWGAHFKSYVELLSALKIPFAVITDGDRVDNVDGTHSLPGEDRIWNLLKTILEPTAFEALDGDGWRSEARDRGLFVGDQTFEIDLLRSGRTKMMCETIKALTTNGAATKRAEVWHAAGNVDNQEQFLKDISEIGKGRYAQRLASALLPRPNEGKPIAPGPQYVLDAIDHVAAACHIP